MPFFVKAAVSALKAYPSVNGRIEGAEIVLSNYYNLGVAVSTDKGLMVPVLADADQLTFASGQGDRGAGQQGPQWDHRRQRFAGRHVHDHQRRYLRLHALDANPQSAQSAILGMHSIQKRAVVVEDQIVIRPMMYLALSYDHRLIDGREAVLFLVRIKECIENPERLLLDV